ncbi:MAG: TIGR04255 family protein [Bdellovibrionales bacterium]|nr:TIGR04255 family protein [Bdellovibrionales bacterium]
MLLNNIVLSRPPIVEALIDIRCEWTAGLDNEAILQRLSTCTDAVKEQFPKIERQVSRTLQFDPHAKAPPNVTQPLFMGFIARSANGERVVQFRRDGLTFSQLAHYKSWDELMGLTRNLWDTFGGCTGTVDISRLATRFINKVRVPFPILDAASQLPGLPLPLTEPSSSSQLKDFVFRTRSLDVPSSSQVVLTRVLEEPLEGAAFAQLVVDIDVFKMVSGLMSNDESIWKTLDSFRDVKNRIFSKSVGSDILDQYR